MAAKKTPKAKGVVCRPVKKNAAKGIGATIVLVIVAQIIHSIEAYLTMGYYTMAEYFPVWSKIMMPVAGPPPMSFYLYSLGFGIVTWALFTMVYTAVGCCLPGKTEFNRGMVFGLLVFFVGTLPGALSMVLLVNLPLGLIGSWVVSGLVLNLINGGLVSKIMK